MFNHRPVVMMVSSVLVLLAAAAVTCETDEKRLVLHSDNDMLQALASLKAEFQAYKVNSSQQITMLERKLTDSTQLTTQLETKLSNSTTLLESKLASSTQRTIELEAKLSNSTQHTTLLESKLTTSSQRITQLESKLADSTKHTNDNFTEAQRQITLLSNRIVDVQANSSRGLRSSYIRWGRNVCPGNAELVYKGYIGGKHYNSEGSGTDSVCLPSDPTWLKYSDGNDPSGSRAYIYGTEIDMAGFNPFDYPVTNMDMPCAVCSVKKASSIMIPARNNCYTGWSLQYNGYLMAGVINHKGAHNHICMDVHPEFVPGGGQSNDEHILFVVEAQCGSLPCPPYVQGRELACVVCSK